jgi:hypothetical protein
VESSGTTCWDDVGNAHIAKIEETESLFSVDGLGVIGNTSVQRQAIEQAITYGGEPISLGTLGRKTYLFSVGSMDAVSISSVGSRNTGVAGNWSHPVGTESIVTDCASTLRPASTGGQGGYVLSVQKTTNGPYICSVTLGCRSFIGMSFVGSVFETSLPQASGSYFYVAVDNQNLVSSLLNGTSVLGCGSGPMIESAIISGMDFANSPNWRVPSDCVAFLVEGWITPA